MGNLPSTSQNEIPDSLTRIGSDMVEMSERARFDLTLIDENESVYPTGLFSLLIWLSSNSTNTFCFDSLKLVKSSTRSKSLTNEIRRIVEDMAVTEEEAERIVSMIKNDLVKALRNQDTIRLWECYGSYRDGLCSHNSDVDLYFRSDNGDDGGFLSGIGKALGLLEDNQLSQETIHRRMEQLLRASPAFTNVYYIQTARVPIFKMYHPMSGKEVDISSNPTSITNTELMKFYVLSNRNVKYLTLYLKHLLSKYHLHGTNKITTTILFWLVVFFMQHTDSLPSVFDARKLRRKIEHYDNGWDHSVPNVERTNSSIDFEKLFLLLLNFLKFYREFGFSQYVICPLIGREIPIRYFKNLQFDHQAFYVYEEKLRKREITGFPVSYINLQDPTIHCNNLAKQTSENVLNSFKILCYHLYENFTAEDGYRKQVLEDYLPSYLCLVNSWYSLTQCYTLYLRFHRNSQRSLMNARRFILNAIRAVMVDILSFDCEYIIPMNDDRRLNYEDVSYTYFQLSANAETWRNSFIYRIFKLSGVPRDVNVAELPISIHIVCEINVLEKRTKIMMESNQHFHKFFKLHLREILTSVLKQRDFTVQTNTPYYSSY